MNLMFHRLIQRRLFWGISISVVWTRLPTNEQFIQQHTRKDATLDLWYFNIPRPYTTKACPQLGNSDQNNIILLPSISKNWKGAKQLPKECCVWSTNTSEDVRASLWLYGLDKFVDEMMICKYIHTLHLHLQINPTLYQGTQVTFLIQMMVSYTYADDLSIPIVLLG